MKEYLRKCCLLIFLDDFQLNQPEAVHQAGRLLAITSSMQVTKHLYYSGSPTDLDGFDSGQSSVFSPLTNNRITNYQKAFENAFDAGFRKVVMLCALTPNLEIKHLEEAFYSLKIIEFCIGPASNGNYFLIGMNAFEPSILGIAEVGTMSKCKATIRAIGELKAALYKLPTLDIV
jgi:hypothetical protein